MNYQGDLAEHFFKVEWSLKRLYEKIQAQYESDDDTMNLFDVLEREIGDIKKLSIN